MQHQLHSDDKHSVEAARVQFSKMASQFECGVSIPGKVISYLLSMEDHPALKHLPPPTRDGLDETAWSSENPLHGIVF